MPRGDDRTWIQTFSGLQIWVFDPHVEDLDIKDIAHGLALNCRYGGQCKFHYSVAQHVVYVAEVLKARGYNRQTVRTGLLHDVFEAYTCDLPRPIKQEMPQYIAAEQHFEMIAAQRFNLLFPYPDCVKQADNDLLATERAAIMATPPRPWSSTGRILDEVSIVQMTWEEAEHNFLEFYNLCRE